MKGSVSTHSASLSSGCLGAVAIPYVQIPTKEVFEKAYTSTVIFTSKNCQNIFGGGSDDSYLLILPPSMFCDVKYEFNYQTGL